MANKNFHSFQPLSNTRVRIGKFDYFFQMCLPNIDLVLFMMKQDDSLKCPRVPGKLGYVERREEVQVTWSIFLFLFWRVYDWCFRRGFRHTLRTIIKRVVSICVGLRVHFNQVQPVEVRIGWEWKAMK